MSSRAAGGRKRSQLTITAWARRFDAGRLSCVEAPPCWKTLTGRSSQQRDVEDAMLVVVLQVREWADVGAERAFHQPIAAVDQPLVVTRVAPGQARAPAEEAAVVELSSRPARARVQQHAAVEHIGRFARGRAFGDHVHHLPMCKRVVAAQEHQVAPARSGDTDVEGVVDAGVAAEDQLHSPSAGVGGMSAKRLFQLLADALDHDFHIAVFLREDRFDGCQYGLERFAGPDCNAHAQQRCSRWRGLRGSR